MRGSVTRHCGCRDANGRRLGQGCPRRRDARHGSWYFVLELPGTADGERKQLKRGGFPTRRDAQHALDETRARLADGERVQEALTVQEWLDEWLPGKRRLRPNSARAYRGHIERYLTPHLGHLPLTDLRVGHVAAMFEAIARETRPPSPGEATMQRIRATLRAALNDAIRQRLLTVNVARLVELPIGRRPPVRVWTPDQLTTFLQAIVGDRLESLFRLVAVVGLRRGEVCGLPWPNVDFDVGQLRVDRQLVEVAGRVVLGEPKSKYGERVLALDDDTITLLQEHRRRQLEERMRAGAAWLETGFVFTRLDGGPLTPAWVTRRFAKLAKAAGLPAIRLHDLRHSSASLGLASGESMKEISERLGHSSITITADTYTHVAPALARDSAQRRAALLRPLQARPATPPDGA